MEFERVDELVAGVTPDVVHDEVCTHKMFLARLSEVERSGIPRV